jgi:uncharacterized membrane-anchored protein YhcB (DUF1043 family)
MSWKAAGALILLIAAFALGWYSGALAGRLGKANAAQKRATEQLDKVLASLGEQNKRAEKLQKTLDRLPRSQGKVRDAVTKSPSDCVLSPDVAASLREAISAANAARALPANP